VVSTQSTWGDDFKSPAKIDELIGNKIFFSKKIDI